MDELIQRQRKLADLLAAGDPESVAIAQSMGYEGPMDDSSAMFDGPMTDLDLPLPQDYGMENEARRLSKYPAPTLANLMQPEQPIAPVSQAQPQYQLPAARDIVTASIGSGQGMFKRSGGDLAELQPQGWTNTRTGQILAAPQQQPAGPMPDYSNPVMFEGTKGYRVKGRPDMMVLNDGSIVTMGVKARGRDLASEKMLAEIERIKAATDKIRGSGGAGSSNGMPEGLKLEKGEVWNPQTGEVESVKGSKLYNKQLETFAEDQSYKNTLSDTTDTTLKRIDTLLGDKAGFSSLFGGYNAEYGTQYLPSGRDANSVLESIKSDLAGVGLARMRVGGSIGAITEKEWKLLADQIASISPKLSEEQARKTLGDIKQTLTQINTRTGEKFKEQWGGSQFAKGSVERSLSGAEQQANLMREAEAAIAKGAPRDLVMKRLQERLKGQ